MADPLANIPASQLGEIPSGKPPSGVKSNFINPPSKTAAVIAVEAIFIALALVFLSGRAYVKSAIIRKLSWDDALVLFAILGCIAAYTADVINASDGGLGKHQWDISLLKSISPANTKGSYIESIVISPTLGCTKLAVFMLYLQLFWPLVWMRFCIYIFATISSAFYLAATVALLVFLTPGAEEGFAKHIFSAREARGNSLSIPTGVVGLVIDIILLILPIRAVANLHLPTRKKIGVAMIFMTGFLACIASAVGLHYRVGRENSTDINWALANVHIMIIIEICGGIICVSAPYWARLVQKHPWLLSPLKIMLSTLIPLFSPSGSHKRQRLTDDGENVKSGESHELENYSRRARDTSSGVDSTEIHSRPEIDQGRNY